MGNQAWLRSSILTPLIVQPWQPHAHEWSYPFSTLFGTCPGCSIRLNPVQLDRHFYPFPLMVARLGGLKGWTKKERVLESGFTLPCMEGALSILNLPYQFDVPWNKVRLWWILFVLPFSCPRALVVRRLVKWAVPIRSGRCYT